MKNLALMILVSLMLAACSGPQADGSGDVLDEAKNVEVYPQSEITIAPDSPVMESTLGALTARILSAPDTTVNDEPYVIQGWTNEEAVVTINDQIFINPAESYFELPVDLEEGPNWIEIVISDMDGNEVSFTLTITYEP